MKVARYNLTTKFYIKDQKIVVAVNGLRIKIDYSDSIYNFLVALEENQIIEDVNIIVESYKINLKLIDLLYNIWVIINLDMGIWLESVRFHKIISNPSICTFPEQSLESYINSIYKNISSYFYDCFEYYHNLERYNIWLYFSFDWIIKKYKSTRKSWGLEANSTIETDKILSLMNNIFSLKNWSNHLYGSGWWFYSIFPVVVCEDDFLFIYDKYNDSFVCKKSMGVYNEYIDSLIVDKWNDFSKYQFHIILVSAYDGVLRKYWNRWYKYIQMEAWAIGTLIRQFLCGENIPYLELQGFFDEKIADLLGSHLWVLKNKSLVCHTICCN